MPPPFPTAFVCLRERERHWSQLSLFLSSPTLHQTQEEKETRGEHQKGAKFTNYLKIEPRGQDLSLLSPSRNIIS